MSAQAVPTVLQKNMETPALYWRYWKGREDGREMKTWYGRLAALGAALLVMAGAAAPAMAADEAFSPFPCARCGESRTAVQLREPTCTRYGGAVLVCLDCGLETTWHGIPDLVPLRQAPLGHTVQDGVCVRCGAGEGEGSGLGCAHVWVPVEGSAPGGEITPLRCRSCGKCSPSPAAVAAVCAPGEGGTVISGR